MQVLFTGLHRSGTSCAAKLCAFSTGLTLLDDPEWAIFHPSRAGAYRSVASFKSDLDIYDLVKCPRMAEQLPVVLDDFDQLGVVFMVRDPRDVYCSILEAQQSPDPTVSTMLDNRRFGSYQFDWEGVALSFVSYVDTLFNLEWRKRERILVCRYEDFVAAPRGSIDHVCARFSLPIVRDVPNSYISMQLAPIRNKRPCDTSIKGPGRWATELPLDISREIWKICGARYLEACALVTNKFSLDK